MFAPMKYKHVEDSAVIEQLLDDPAWAVEQKHDGTYGMAVLRYGEEPLMTLDGRTPLKHTAATQWLPGIWEALRVVQAGLGPEDFVVLEGEIMIHSGEYRVWDMPAAHDGTVRVPTDTPWSERRYALAALFTAAIDPDSVVKMVLSIGGDRKREFVAGCMVAGVEGVVFKHRDATYRPGQRVTDVLKYKFVKTADVIVTEVVRERNEAGRETGYIKFGVAAPAEWEMTPEQQATVHPVDGTSAWVLPVGRCSVIGKPHVEPGNVIEVAYLYWTGATTYQPRMVRIREDKAAEACLIDQFRPYSREVV